MSNQRQGHKTPGSSTSPFLDKDRLGEQSGWGRRVEGTVRLMKPASRFNLIEPDHKLIKPVESRYLKDEPLRPDTREAADHLTHAPTTNTRQALENRVYMTQGKQSILRRSVSHPPASESAGLRSSRDFAVPPMPASHRDLPDASTPRSRSAARQMFERYGLSPPTS